MKKTVRLLLGLAIGVSAFSARGTDHDKTIGLKGRAEINRTAKVLYFPSEMGEGFTRERMRVLAVKRARLIQSLHRAILETHSSERRCEMMLRLGRTYLEDYYARIDVASRTFEAQLAAFNKTHRNARFMEQMDTVAADRALKSALETYEAFRKRFSTHPRLDEALYFQSIAFQNAGRPLDAINVQNELVQHFPQSHFYSSALIELGDYYFLQNDWARAESHYDQVIRLGEGKLLAYGHYKKGWCEYNQSRPAVALAELKSVIAQEKNSEGNPIQLTNEVLTDIALPMADLGLEKDAIDFFRPYGDPYYHRGVESIARKYGESGRYDKAIRMWQYLVDSEPQSPKSPIYELEIISCSELQNKPSQVISRFAERTARFVSGSSWQEVNGANSAAVRDGLTKWEETLRRYALNYHSLAQKTQDNARYALAQQLYAVYLETFSNDPHAATLYFNNAEILRRQGKIEAAADNYFASYQRSKDPEQRRDAMRASLGMLDQQVNEEHTQRGMAQVNGNNSTRMTQEKQVFIPYSPVEERFSRRVVEYFKAYPTAPDAAVALYELGYLKYIHYDLDAAITVFNLLIRRFPHDSMVPSAAQLAMDALNRKGDYPALVATCQRYLSHGNIGKSSVTAEIRDVLRHAELKKIQAREGKGEWAAAAKDYVDYTVTYGVQDETLYAQAVYNAAIAYSKAGDWLQAAEMQEKFLRRFPKHGLTEAVLLQAGKSFELMGKSAKAAELFRRFATTYPRNPQSRNALRMATIYYWGVGQPESAEETFRALQDRFPAEASLLEKDVAEMYELRNDLDREIAWQEQLARRDSGVGERFVRLVTIAELEGRKNGTGPSFSPDLKSQARRQPTAILNAAGGASALAKVELSELQSLQARFERIRIDLPGANQGALLKGKLSLLREMEAAAAHIGRFGDGPTHVASLYLLAQGYLRLQEDVRHVPIPAELTGKELDGYRSEIERTLVQPLGEKAQNYALQCTDRAQELHQLSPLTSKCVALLTVMDPVRFPGIRTLYLPATEIALSLRSHVATPKENQTLAAIGFPSGFFSRDEESSSTRAALYSLRPGRSLASLSDETQMLAPALFTASIPESTHQNGEVRSRLEDMLSKKPGDPELTHLLALDSLKKGNYAAAKMLWLSLVSRGLDSAAIWNNLGVLMIQAGQDQRAYDYFNRAIQMEPLPEALANLGNLALKYGNGSMARQAFQQAAKAVPDSVEIQGSLAEAMIQEGKRDEARELLSNLQKKNSKHPYVVLALANLIIGADKDFESTGKMLSDFVSQQRLQEDPRFREALEDAAHRMEASRGLPSIEQ